MEKDLKDIGQRIADLMAECGYSQSELAGLCGITPAALCHYLKGIREPRLSVVKNMATALGTTSDYLLTGEEEEVEFNRTRSIVARCRANLTYEQKMELIRILSK